MEFLKNKKTQVVFIIGMVFVLLSPIASQEDTSLDFLVKHVNAQAAPLCSSSEVAQYIENKYYPSGGSYNIYDHLSCTVTAQYTWDDINANAAAFNNTACADFYNNDNSLAPSITDDLSYTCSEIEADLAAGAPTVVHKWARIGDDYYSFQVMIEERSCQEIGNPSYQCSDQCYWRLRPGYRFYCDFNDEDPSSGTSPSVTLVASPPSVASGEPATLSWTVSNATSCSASASPSTSQWNGTITPANGSKTINNITANTTYTLECTNADGSGSASDSVTVTPPAPPRPTASCSPSTQTISPGDTASFIGDTTGLSLGSCSWIAIGGSPSTSGPRPNYNYCSSFSTTYNTALPFPYPVIYSVRDRFGFPYLDTCEVNVTNASASNPPSVSISAAPPSVASGSQSTLTWTVSGGSATSCVASGGWSGNKSTSGGSQLITGITSTTAYTLTCSNADGSDADSATVTVTGGGGSAPSVNLSASPISVTSGGPSTLTWTVSGSATSCMASGDWSGSKSTSGGSQQMTNITTNKAYVLTCTNSNGSDNDNATVTVSGPSTYSLTTIRSGQGTVTSSPSGINCGGTCNATYDDGTDVTLTATPNPGWRFTGWGGDCSGTNPQCTLTINGSKSVTASFRPNLVYEEF